MSAGDSAAVATWYSKGWNRWWLWASISVRSTPLPVRQPKRRLQAAEPGADHHDFAARRHDTPPGASVRRPSPACKATSGVHAGRQQHGCSASRSVQALPFFSRCGSCRPSLRNRRKCNTRNGGGLSSDPANPTGRPGAAPARSCQPGNHRRLPARSQRDAQPCNRRGPSMPNGHYDLIVIGSGPGGASLAQRLAPTGKRILMLERGGYLPRSRANWDSKTVFVDAAYQAKETWYGATARSSIRACTTSSAATPRCTARRCCACASRTSAKFGTRTASPPPGRSATTCSSRTTARRRSCTTSTASAGRTRTSRGPALPTPTRPSSTSRASSNWRRC